MKTKGLYPSEIFFVFIVFVYVLFQIRLYCELLSVNIPKRNTYKTRDIFLPNYFL